MKYKDQNELRHTRALKGRGRGELRGRGRGEACAWKGYGKRPSKLTGEPPSVGPPVGHTCAQGVQEACRRSSAAETGDR